MRILLVEDEPSAARFIAKGLRVARAADARVDHPHGGQIEIVSSGPEGSVFAATVPMSQS